jgi:Na+-translocating ferredoxin:NAD+ oxidoreductase subunit A
MDIFAIIISAIFVSNIALVRFLGICPFLGVSKSVDNAIGMSFAAIFVVFFASIISFSVYHLVLAPLQLEYLNLIAFILIIASFVQFVEMFLKKFLVGLYKSLGIYLPLITTNCVVLGVALENVTLEWNFWQMLAYSSAVPLGFAMVLILFSVIRERLAVINRLPGPFKGAAIAFIITGLMTMAFVGFGGLVL